MANYSVSNGLGGTLQATTATYKTLALLTATTGAGILCSGRIYDVMFGTLGTPSEQTYEWDISRSTGTVGTGTSATPNPLDPSGRSAGATGTVNHTAEPSVYTAASSVFYIGTNQRASYRWIAAPGSELVWPATNLSGFGLRTRSASGGTVTATAQFYFTE